MYSELANNNPRHQFTVFFYFFTRFILSTPKINFCHTGIYLLVSFVEPLVDTEASTPALFVK